MTRKKREKRPGSLVALSEVLPALCREIHWERKVNELAVLALWPHQTAVICGSRLSEGSRATGIRQRADKTILTVRVAHATIASELSFHVSALTDALNRFSPQTGVTIDRIQLTVGEV